MSESQVFANPLDGYFTQAEISLRVADGINNGRLNFWFSSRFNPITNRQTSNPLWIFQQLDAAEQTGHHNEKTKNLISNLLRWVDGFLDQGLIGEMSTAADVKHMILSAHFNGGLQPRVFHLHQVVGYQKKGQPDEYRLDHVPFREDRRIRQILPPVLPAEEEEQFQMRVRRAPAEDGGAWEA